MNRKPHRLALAVALAAAAAACAMAKPSPPDRQYSMSPERGLQCRVYGVEEYCSVGPRESILKLETGEVVCGAGPCRENRDGSYSCAPSRWAKITQRPGDVGFSCFENGRQTHCERPSASRCASSGRAPRPR